MKPGKEEGSILFEKNQEMGVVMDAAATYSTDEEYKLIKRRLLLAKAPYELRMPHSEVAIRALRRSAKLDIYFYPGERQRAADMLADYESTPRTT